MTRRLIVDIDGTLTPIKRSGESYADLVPFHPMIEQLREYQARGFEIVLSTARNMRTHEGNIGKINKMTAPVLIAWLEKWDIPYDEIHFGKPWPGSDGFYVDDRAVRPDEFLKLSHEEILELQQASRDFIASN